MLYHNFLSLENFQLDLVSNRPQSFDIKHFLSQFLERSPMKIIVHLKVPEGLISKDNKVVNELLSVF